MDQAQARFAAICSCLMFLFALGTAFCWWRVLAIDHEAIGSTVTLRELVPIHVPQESEKAKKQEGNTSTTAPNNPIIESSSSSTVANTPPIAKELPKQFTLKVPFTSQAPEKNWDQPWQDACEEAAMLMIDAYYKKYTLSPPFARDEILKMVAWEEEQGWDRSIEIKKIAQTFTDYLKLTPTKKVRIIENPTVKQIKQFIANGQPVLAVADGKVLPNPHFQNGGPEYHALIIKGYNETDFITNDPGTQFGENFSYAYDDVMSSLRDWNNGDVKSGRRVVLVIE